MGNVAAQGLYPTVPDGSGGETGVVRGLNQEKGDWPPVNPTGPELHGEHMPPYSRELAASQITQGRGP